MHLIWKRPDGFVGASPMDYYVINVGNQYQMWLQFSNVDWYPFQVSGDWREAEHTKKLNNMVNLIEKPPEELAKYLAKIYNHSMGEVPTHFHHQTLDWLMQLRRSLKGDNWEKEIMDGVLSTLIDRVKNILPLYLEHVAKSAN